MTLDAKRREAAGGPEDTFGCSSLGDVGMTKNLEGKGFD